VIAAMPDWSTDNTVQVRQLFDAKAAHWSSKYSPDGRLTGRLTQLAAALNRHAPVGGSVLDLGCGTGELARAAANTGLRVIACDISPEMLRRAEANDPASAVDWVRLDLGWRTLPFEPGTFDAIVASSVLEYVDDPATVLAECARVLRAGGVLLCTVPNVTNPIRWMEWIASRPVRFSPLHAALGGRMKLLEEYMTYLRTSRNRRSLQWWHSAAHQAGLSLIRSHADARSTSPLRLLTYARPQPTEAHS
jgi:SAM-dependent methyltransferase